MRPVSDSITEPTPSAELLPDLRRATDPDVRVARVLSVHRQRLDLELDGVEQPARHGPALPSVVVGDEVAVDPELHLTVGLTGTADEVSLVQEVACQMRHEAIVLAGIVLFYRYFAIVSFDPTMAASIGSV